MNYYQYFYKGGAKGSRRPFDGDLTEMKLWVREQIKHSVCVDYIEFTRDVTTTEHIETIRI